MKSNVMQDLQKVDVLRGLSADEVASLMVHAGTFTFTADQPIFEAGASERALYFLLEGTVEIALTVPFSTEVILDQLQPIRVFGESSFFHPQPHSATARTLTEVTVARLDRSAYDQLLQSNHLAACRVGANAAEILAAKLQSTDRWIADLLQAEEAQRAQEKWWEFRKTMGHSLDQPAGGGFISSSGWR